MNLETDGQDEVLIRDGSVLILVKVIEDYVTHIVVNWEAPHVQKRDQLVFLDESIAVLVERLEGLAHSLPLGSDFVDKLLHDVALSLEIDCSCSRIHTLTTLLFLYMLLKCWVFPRVVAEDKRGQIMNLVALPQTKVSIVQLSRTILARADIFHDFDQV